MRIKTVRAEKLGRKLDKTRKQLDRLRKTRAQRRRVGTVGIPKHLQQPERVDVPALLDALHPYQTDALDGESLADHDRDSDTITIDELPADAAAVWAKIEALAEQVVSKDGQDLTRQKRIALVLQDPANQKLVREYDALAPRSKASPTGDADDIAARRLKRDAAIIRAHQMQVRATWTKRLRHGSREQSARARQPRKRGPDVAKAIKKLRLEARQWAEDQKPPKRIVFSPKARTQNPQVCRFQDWLADPAIFKLQTAALADLTVSRVSAGPTADTLTVLFRDGDAVVWKYSSVLKLR